jgi:hypothetical protein
VELDLLFDRYMIFAGDRLHGEDVALTAGVAWVDGVRCVFVAADERLSSAAAYGKATRMVGLADRTGAPCVCVGSTATSHLDRVTDARSAGALDTYVRTLVTSDALRVAVLEGGAPTHLADDFDAIVSPSTGDGASHGSYALGDMASARGALAAVLRGLAAGTHDETPFA